MEKTVSGIKVEGDWKEVVESGEKVSETLKETISSEDYEEWEYWRPKNNENIKEEVKEKTIEIACIDESPIEESENSVKSEFKKAFTRIKNSVISRRRVQNLKKGSKKLARTTEALTRKILRKIEKTVYKYIISKTNAQYFDTDKVSASLDQKNDLFNKKEEPEYVMKVIINDEEICKEVQEEV